MDEQQYPRKIAIIIDNVVTHLITVEESLHAALLSSPLIMDIDPINKINTKLAIVGSTYNAEEDTFTLPEDFKYIPEELRPAVDIEDPNIYE